MKILWKKFKRVAPWSAMVCLALYFSGCTSDEPLKLGFAGGLTGRLSDLGISGRDGALLAVEEANEKDGVNGRRLELIVRDDGQDPKMALAADRDLMALKVAAVVGHMTSAMSVAVVDEINQSKMVMMSPTTSTNLLAGRDDFFFQILPPNRAETEHMAQIAWKWGCLPVSVVLDRSNAAYSTDYFNHFKRGYESRGGKISGVVKFFSGPHVNMKHLAAQVMEADPPVVLIVAGALDAALICQHIRIMGKHPRILCAGWAMTQDFILNGGPASDGAYFSNVFDENSQAPAYVTYRERFTRRFGYPPNFASVCGYDAAHVVITALKQNPDPSCLKKTILDISEFRGLQSPIIFDAHGDPGRDRLTICVQAGRFAVVE